MDMHNCKKGEANAAARNYFTHRIARGDGTYYQLPPVELIARAVELGEGVLCDTGALVIDTGEFTGRSLRDRYIVKDQATTSAIDWNDINQPIEEKYFNRLFNKMMNYMAGKKLWVRDCAVCAKEEYRLAIRVVNENPCCNPAPGPGESCVCCMSAISLAYIVEVVDGRTTDGQQRILEKIPGALHERSPLFIGSR